MEYIPPMQAANPALAIEQATVRCILVNILHHLPNLLEHTANFSLAPTLCRGYGATALEEHANSLHRIREVRFRHTAALTAAVRRKVSIDFSGSSLMN